MIPEELTPEEIKLLTSFIRSLIEDRQDKEQPEAWKLWDRFMQIETIIAKRLDR
jgi:hypothetical protein